MTQFMSTVRTTIPRDINSWRAAAILYGDWGTSKAYVLGLAFALAGFSSFWFIFAVGILTILVALNYLTICRLYPDGGGVYASVRDRSKVLSLVGAFLLIADYLVTAALSALSAFNYLGVDQPLIWAIVSIGIIGILNFLGPKHSGEMAIALAVPTVLVVVCLGLMSIPFLPEAIHKLTPPSKDYIHDWGVFASIIIALSGIEAIANTTNSMKLNKGSTKAAPSVTNTSTPAILRVMVEVCVFTSLLGLAMNALPGIEMHNGTLDAPGYPNVRDAMMRYMGEVFAGTLFGPTAGHVFSIIISIVITLLLLSAVNTAIIALVSLLFLMSRDGEVPFLFQKLNRFGVPIYSTIFAFLLPMIILLFVSDVLGLANLYAVGFMGAIAVNLGATSTNLKMGMSRWQRSFMFGTFILVAMIEISLFIDKGDARNFVITIIAVGLLLRGLVFERKERIATEKLPLLPEPPEDLKGGILVVVTAIGKVLDYALEEAKLHHSPLYILFVRVQKVITEEDHLRLWVDDEEACKIFDYVIDKTGAHATAFLYTVTAHSAHSIAEIAKEKAVDQVFVGRRRGIYSVLNFIRGTTTGDLLRCLPSNINLVAIY